MDIFNAAEPTTELVVESKEIASEGVVALILRSSETLPEWSPGAHIDLHMGNRLIRQYSLCGDVSDRTRYRVAILREPDGRGGSRWVHDVLKPGDTVTASAPRNNFALIESPAYLFIAGGIGLTPILPMLATAEERGADWRLLYGGRARSSMAFLDELERHGERVTVHPQDEMGLLPLDRWLAEPRPSTQIYACGPEPLLSAVESRCSAWPDGSLHFERFKAPEDNNESVNAPFEVVLNRSGITVPVPPGMTILEALEGQGLIVLSSCREGTCGTCETKVLGGIPDHRDCVLTNEEKQANNTMMVCVSRARSPRLELDL